MIKKFLSFVFLVVVILITAGCNLFLNSSVTAKIIVGLPASRSITDDISFYEVWVTASDIEDILVSGELSDISSTATIEVKKGSDRKVTVKLYDNTKSIVLFQGEKVIDISSDGNIAVEINVNQNVRTVAYVSSDTGSNTNDGTKDSPFKTIQKGIDSLYDNGSDAGSVIVAAGEYAITSTITLKDRVQILGGYNGSTWTKDGSTTRIAPDTSVSEVFSGSALTSGTVLIDGFDIEVYNPLSSGSVLDVSAGSILTFSNNDVLMDFDTADTQYIKSSNSKLVVTNNNFLAGTSFSWGARSTAIYLLDGGEALIYNNIIKSQTAGEEAGAIITDHTGTYDLIIRNNTINGGASMSDIGGIIGTRSAFNISVSSTAILNLTVDNNIFTTDNSSEQLYVLFSSAPLANVTINSFRNNIIDFVPLISGLYADYDGTDWPITDFETNITNAYDNLENYSSILLSDISSDDYTFGGDATATETEGGIDGSAAGWEFSTDIDGTLRTGNGSTGWSIGAYEQD